ncbi:MAG: hypothetical protein KA401_00015 [Anaerolineae bacterium]|nr:hypothetical protein [Chloroflexota bacterium]MBP6297702.1 hypothetical protein [Anaerolineae bacterium]
MQRIVSFDPTSRRVRFAHYFTVAYCIIGLVLAVNLRDSVLYATTEFRNNEVGIVAYYPKDWLLDTRSAVLRATDSARLGFKTVIEVNVEPFAPRMSARNVIDGLTLERQAALPYYRNLTTFEQTLRTQDVAVVSEYSYVYAPNDPFLQAITAVVIGRDVLVIRRNQAILITFQADARTYEQDLALFDRFLDALEY